MKVSCLPGLQSLMICLSEFRGQWTHVWFLSKLSGRWQRRVHPLKFSKIEWKGSSHLSYLKDVGGLTGLLSEFNDLPVRVFGVNDRFVWVSGANELMSDYFQNCLEDNREWSPHWIYLKLNEKDPPFDFFFFNSLVRIALLECIKVEGTLSVWVWTDVWLLSKLSGR